jgi:chromosome segregation ATPase
MITTNDPHSVVSNVTDASQADSGKPPETGASIDKVRDILFGGQMREVDRRFARIEERLTKELADLRDDLRKRLDTLDAHVRRENDALADLLKAERTDRTDAHGALSSEMKEQGRTHERRASALDDQLTKGHRDLRQQILEQHQQLSDEIRQKAEEILATLGREAQQLRSDKTDRSALAALLTEVAMRLNNEFHIPGVEDARNG